MLKPQQVVLRIVVQAPIKACKYRMQCECKTWYVDGVLLVPSIVEVIKNLHNKVIKKQNPKLLVFLQQFFSLFFSWNSSRQQDLTPRVFNVAKYLSLKKRLQKLKPMSLKCTIIATTHTFQSSTSSWLLLAAYSGTLTVVTIEFSLRKSFLLSVFIIMEY